jgi:hypothetical protein
MIIANAHKHTPVSNEDTGLVVARRRGLCKSQMIHLRRRCGPFAFDSCFESRMGASRLLSFLVLVLISDRTGTATSPWLVDPTTNREYSLVASKGKRFTRCEAACRALGASMPCIRSRGESNFVRKEVVAGDDFWIGLYQKSLCTWKWTSSECESNDFEDWSLGQPNNVGHFRQYGPYYFLPHSYFEATQLTIRASKRRPCTRKQDPTRQGQRRELRPPRWGWLV